jgi:hypothetical protein
MEESRITRAQFINAKARQCHGWGCHLGVLSPEHAYSSGVRVSGSDGLGSIDHDCRSR